jgi:hypothetical protein
VTSVVVESYAGYKADERPLRLWLAEQTLETVGVEDKRYAPCFRVRVEGDDRYVLRHVGAQDTWGHQA